MEAVFREGWNEDEEGSFGIAANSPIVLKTTIEKNKPYLTTFHWFGQSQSPFTEKGENGIYDVFCRCKRWSFGAVTSRSIVLEAMAG